jgi:uncharacterized protein (DUF1697 family)
MRGSLSKTAGAATRLTKIVESKAAYNLITIRNANTTLKLAALAEGDNGRWKSSS